MIKIPVFYYHSIGNQGPETLATPVFREHLSTIRELGFRTITFSQLRQINRSDQNKYIVLTFDDGLLDNYDNALPVLQEYGFKATFFVIPGFDNITRWVNPKTSQWSDQKRDGFTIPFPNMQPHHRSELVRLGMEIGSHSLTHPKLTKIPHSSLPAEIIDSKKLLQDQLGSEVSSFCYPKGRYNREVLKYVNQAGYTAACTTMPGYCRSDSKPLECRRFLIEKSTLFKQVLQWAATGSTAPQLIFDAIRPFLKFKNTYL